MSLGKSCIIITSTAFILPKVSWLLTVIGARTGSVYAELYEMLCTVFIVARAGAAVAIAVRAADQVRDSANDGTHLT